MWSPSRSLLHDCETSIFAKVLSSSSRYSTPQYRSRLCGQNEIKGNFCSLVGVTSGLSRCEMICSKNFTSTTIRECHSTFQALLWSENLIWQQFNCLVTKLQRNSKRMCCTLCWGRAGKCCRQEDKNAIECWKFVQSSHCDMTIQCYI